MAVQNTGSNGGKAGADINEAAGDITTGGLTPTVSDTMKWLQ